MRHCTALTTYSAYHIPEFGIGYVRVRVVCVVRLRLRFVSRTGFARPHEQQFAAVSLARSQQLHSTLGARARCSPLRALGPWMGRT